MDYNFDICFIFLDKCFKCYGFDVNKWEFGLCLDIEVGVYVVLKD